MLIGLGHCEETAHLPLLRSVTWNLFPFVQGSKSVNFISVSLFSSMHPNELNTVLKYGRGLMRKNEHNAHLGLQLPPPVPVCRIQRPAASILTAKVFSKSRNTFTV